MFRVLISDINENFGPQKAEVEAEEGDDFIERFTHRTFFPSTNFAGQAGDGVGEIFGEELFAGGGGAALNDGNGENVRCAVARAGEGKEALLESEIFLPVEREEACGFDRCRACDQSGVEHVEEPQREIILKWLEERVVFNGLTVEFPKNITEAIVLQNCIGSEGRCVAERFLFPHSLAFRNKPLQMSGYIESGGWCVGDVVGPVFIQALDVGGEFHGFIYIASRYIK